MPQLHSINSTTSKDPTDHVTSITKERPSMTPTFHGSGSGGHGFGTGQLRGQSTHEHASLEFYKIMAVEKFSPRLPQSSGHLIQILILSVSSMRVNEKAFGREKVPRYLQRWLRCMEH